MGEAVEKLRTTERDYLRGEDGSAVKHELVYGEVYAMSGGGAFHSLAAARFVRSVGGQLQGGACEVFTSDFKVRVDHAEGGQFFYPDASVVCGPTDSMAQFTERPTVVVEVLSPSTRKYDLTLKRVSYLTLETLKVLIFIDAEAVEVLVYRKVGEGVQIERYLDRGDVVRLPEIGADFSVEEIYEGIEFDKVS